LDPSVLSTLSTLSLILQVIAFVIILYAITKKNEVIEEHRQVASLALYIILPTLLLMFYSASRGFELHSYGAVLALHKLLGTIVILFAILFVTNRWRFKKKIHMDIEIACWTATLVLGVVVYLISFGYIGS